MSIDLNNKEELKSIINYGYSIVNELFKLSDDELRIKLKTIVDKKYHGIINNSNTITRTIINMNPKKIEIVDWDKLIIEWFGIDYKPGHGLTKRIREFDKHFVL